MTTVWLIDIIVLGVIVVAAGCVTFMSNLNGSVMALSALGIGLTTIFVVLAAPDVAHSEAVVGAVVLPLLYLLAIGKIRASAGALEDLSETGDGERAPSGHERSTR